jgi:hypothetical protein
MHLIHLDMLAGGHAHPRSNGGAIALGSHQLDLDPVLLVAPDIAEQRRQIVHIQDQHIHAAVVVIVSKSRAPAGKALTDTGIPSRRNVLEMAIAEIPYTSRGFLNVSPKL